MTPTQLDEAIQALQPDSCHDNSVEDDEEPSGGGVPEEEVNNTLRVAAEEPQVQIFEYSIRTLLTRWSASV